MFVTFREVLDEANSSSYEAMTAGSAQNIVNRRGHLVDHVDLLDLDRVGEIHATILVHLLLIGILVRTQDQVRKLVTINIENSIVVFESSSDAVGDVGWDGVEGVLTESTLRFGSLGIIIKTQFFRCRHDLGFDEIGLSYLLNNANEEATSVLQVRVEPQAIIESGLGARSAKGRTKKKSDMQATSVRSKNKIGRGPSHSFNALPMGQFAMSDEEKIVVSYQ
jgi:hypothetical protein